MSQYEEHLNMLGLGKGATPEEIKKAYFRLVRKYTPEKHPEEFQKIRKAYEELQNHPADMEEAELKLKAFPPEDPMLALSYKRAVSLANGGWLQDGAKILEEILFHSPKELGVRNLLWEYYCELEKWQKAAKLLEETLQLFPEKENEYRPSLAFAYMNRGWTKKAMKEYERAYQTCTHSYDFLFNYAHDAFDTKQYELMSKLCWEALRKNVSVKQYADETMEFLYLLAVTEKISKADLKEFTDRLLSLQKEKLEGIADASFTIMNMLSASFELDLSDREVYDRLDETIISIGKLHPKEDYNALACRITLADNAMENERADLHPDWKKLLTRILPENQYRDKNVRRMAMVDSMLCFIREWDEVEKEYPYIQRKYPVLLEGYEPLFEQLQAGKKEELFDSLMKEYNHYSQFIQGGEYIKRYPEGGGEYVFTTQELGGVPFVREGEKIGRNAPCPCGSGKKFKQCCMGKGIYD